jgi:hypothetical protein
MEALESGVNGGRSCMSGMLLELFACMVDGDDRVQGEWATRGGGCSAVLL